MDKQQAVVKEQRGNLENNYEQNYCYLNNGYQQLFDEYTKVKSKHRILFVIEAEIRKIFKPAMQRINKMGDAICRQDQLAISLKLLRSCFLHGISGARWRKNSYVIMQRKPYDLCCTDKYLELQRNHTSLDKCIFTLIVYVKTLDCNEIFLQQMIRSVREQTFEHWELYIICENESVGKTIRALCTSFIKQDQRIHYITKSNNESYIKAANNCMYNMAAGQYFVFVSLEDQLHPAALYEIKRILETKGADFVYTDEKAFLNSIDNIVETRYKPDYSPIMLRSYNYISRLFTFSKQAMIKAGGGLKEEYNCGAEYDLILRLTETAVRIVHLQMPLYYRRHIEKNKECLLEQAIWNQRALENHIKRLNIIGRIECGIAPNTFHVHYAIKGNPKISIIIPNKDHIEELKLCICSIREKSTWKNWEIIIVENNSKEQKTFEYYKKVTKEEPKIQVVFWEKGFNYSAICNYGAQFAEGEYLLMLNNDIQVITSEWLEEMLMCAQQRKVGIVGAKLYYPNDTVQHAGVILGIGGVAGHGHRSYCRGSWGYMKRLVTVQEYSAVTAACALIPRRVWEQVKGFDESFEVAYNDIDLCMRIRREGFLVIWTPFAELYHYESISRGRDTTKEQKKRYIKEVNLFQKRWMKELLQGDPYYNLNLTQKAESFQPMKRAK